MGICTEGRCIILGCSVQGVCFWWCESRVRPSPGRRTVSLVSPCPGGRSPLCHCRQVWDKAQGAGANGRCCICTLILYVLQDLASWLELSDRYKVWSGFVSGFLVWVRRRSDGSVRSRGMVSSESGPRIHLDIWVFQVDTEGGFKDLITTRGNEKSEFGFRIF
ncbi:hypothetical protein V6N13_069339 [Hibiscus sabdariffa]|uniref:Uncharacterized protein n=1 Tax=Hibiscus sabdariffa TaxID=183260 RepID=A0ABR2PGG4_9ROSI